MLSVKPLYVILLTSLFTPQAGAEVFRCIENGKTVYSGTPCGKNAKKIEVSSSLMTSGYAQEKERRRIFLAKNQDIKPVYRQAIEAGVVIPGMTEQQALASMGEPKTKNLSQGKNYSKWQWVYERPTGQRQYIYIENGVVVGSN